MKNRRFRRSRAQILIPMRAIFCRETEFAAIDRYVWQGDYRCEARAYVTRGADALNVLMCAKEKTIHVEAKRFNRPRLPRQLS